MRDDCHVIFLILGMQIRRVHIDDADQLLDIYRPYVEQTAFTFETTAPTVEQFAGRIRTNTEKYPWLVAEDKGRVIGYAYAGKHREREAYQWCVESSVYVLESYHGKGLAKQLYEPLFDILRDCGYINVYAGITMPNPKSFSFHAKMGFEHVGVYKNIGYKLGRWHDVGWMVKVLREHGEKPEVPRKW